MRMQHLLLSSLKIVIAAASVDHNTTGLVDAILHPCLISLCTCSDESVRGVVADCLGILMEGHSGMVMLDIVRRQGWDMQCVSCSCYIAIIH